MRAARFGRFVAAAACAGGLGVGLFAIPASAAPGQAQTFNLHGAAANDQLVVDFLPIDSPPGVSLPGGCWMPTTDALMSVSGNLIFHQNFNKTGGWFTATFTGDAAVYPIVFASPGVPELDSNGNDVVDTSETPAATGHLTLWDGSADNNKNGVEHATLTFMGTDSSGNAVSLSGHFQFTVNANGTPTATLGSLTC